MRLRALLLKLTKGDWFTPALLLMILLGWLIPGPGIKSGLFSLKQLAEFGISVIFFLYGLRLSVKQLIHCVTQWRLHLVIQSVTFIIFPVIILLLSPLFAYGPFSDLWLGVFFLAALPSTVSSAVVMVSLAGGNIPGAVFNATVSSIAGILITPLWMGFFIQGSEGGADILPVFIKLTYQILVPMVLGILLHPRFGELAIRKKDFTRYFDQSVVLAIVYTSFSSSFNSGIFKGYGMVVILLLILFLILFFLAIIFIIRYLTRLAGLGREDMITTMFCGSTKSLMHGTVMAKVLLNNAATVGLLLLPILIYHALQLVFTGFMSQRFARKIW